MSTYCCVKYIPIINGYRVYGIGETEEEAIKNSNLDISLNKMQNHYNIQFECYECEESAAEYIEKYGYTTIFYKNKDRKLYLNDDIMMHYNDYICMHIHNYFDGRIDVKDCKNLIHEIQTDMQFRAYNDQESYVALKELQYIDIIVNLLDILELKNLETPKINVNNIINSAIKDTYSDYLRVYGNSYYNNIIDLRQLLDYINFAYDNYQEIQCKMKELQILNNDNPKPKSETKSKHDLTIALNQEFYNIKKYDLNSINCDINTKEE